MNITFYGWRMARKPEFRRDLMAVWGAGTPAIPSQEAMGAAVIILRSVTAATLCQKKGKKFFCTDAEMTEFCNKNTAYLDKIWSAALSKNSSKKT